MSAKLMFVAIGLVPYEQQTPSTSCGLNLGIWVRSGGDSVSRMTCLLRQRSLRHGPGRKDKVRRSHLAEEIFEACPTHL